MNPRSVLLPLILAGSSLLLFSGCEVYDDSPRYHHRSTVYYDNRPRHDRYDYAERDYRYDRSDYRSRSYDRGYDNRDTRVVVNLDADRRNHPDYGSRSYGSDDHGSYARGDSHSKYDNDHRGSSTNHNSGYNGASSNRQGSTQSHGNYQAAQGSRPGSAQPTEGKKDDKKKDKKKHD